MARVTAKTYRLLGADGRACESPAKGLFGGNARAKIYGRLDCPSALRAVGRGRTYARHRVFFADEASARAAGYRPCAVCMRDAYDAWRQAAGSPHGRDRRRNRKSLLSAAPNTKQTAYGPGKKS